MGIFDRSSDTPQDQSPRGANGNVRDTRSAHAHAAVDETPHTNAVRRSDHEPKHAASE